MYETNTLLHLAWLILFRTPQTPERDKALQNIETALAITRAESTKNHG